ncbi:MAG: hypothetical protein ISR76_06730 [Planctomycetes bacterium]|nr:hypothetical protein [Planctomycetota bacterium]
MALPAVPATDPGEGVVSLTHKRYRDWDIELPAESFTPVGDSIRLEGGRRVYAAALEGTLLRLDLDGDGVTDVALEGETASVLLRGADGFRYAARLRQGPNGWVYAASGAMVGELDGHRVALIDQDNDGLYGEIGQDAILVGRGKVATFLGETLSFGGELRSVDASPDGRELRLASYRGETGRLNVAGGFDGQGKILSAVVRSSDGRHCFDLARTEGPTTVPAGRYRLESGKIGMATMAVTVGPGGSPAIEVPAGGETTFEWGGPVRAEFGFQRQGDQLAFSPDHIWYFGEGGEQYLKWWPVGKSPVFTVIDKTTEQEVARAMFPGSC